MDRRRIAVVTGASRGLGLTIARFLAAGGFDLVIDGRDSRTLEAVATDLRLLGAAVEAVAGDVTDPGHRGSLLEGVQRAGDGLDLLVNNASSLGPEPLAPLAATDAGRLEAAGRAFEVNVLAPIALTAALLPALERRGGRIVNVSSDAATGAYSGWGVYGATKAALDLVTRTLANELSEAGSPVAAVSVDPGDMRTEMHQAAFAGDDISDRPDPDVTVPFWAWLAGRTNAEVNGRRYAAQAERWEVAPCA